jgi:hypothetical protein
MYFQYKIYNSILQYIVHVAASILFLRHKLVDYVVRSLRIGRIRNRTQEHDFVLRVYIERMKPDESARISV